MNSSSALQPPAPTLQPIYPAGGVVQIAGLVDATAYEGLGTLIEEHLIAQQLPLLRDLYQRGQTVAFGKLLLFQRGVSDWLNVVNWEDFDDAAFTILATSRCT
jgi:hypothetical protein